MLIVTFLPGGLIEGAQRIGRLFISRSRADPQSGEAQSRPAPAE